MKQSVRAKRMERNHKRNAQQTKLSLVSLMDIFTILVFFLMLNASDVQVLDNHKSVTLPEATSEIAAKETLLILVNENDILLEGQKVADVRAVLSTSQDIISVLSAQLIANKPQVEQGLSNASESSVSEGHAITIMGDENVPYALLKKIMTTCADAGFTNVSLAIEQVLANQRAEEVSV